MSGLMAGHTHERDQELGIYYTALVSRCWKVVGREVEEWVREKETLWPKELMAGHLT